jgi:hypothetical protein
MTTETLLDDWVLIEAAKRANIGEEPIEYLRKIYPRAGSFRALCDMIQKHEAFKREVSDAMKKIVNDPNIKPYRQEPLYRFIISEPDPLADRRLACALEAIESIRGRATHAVIAIRAIELYEQGFGK